MPDAVTLNITTDNNGTKPFTINVEDKKFINSVITVGDNYTITEEQAKKLQEIARRNGDFGILELCDLNSNEKINLAYINGYGEYYEIKLSKHGKYYQVTIKETGFFTKDPTLNTIKVDFGVRFGVFIDKNEILHGNEDLINSRDKKMTAEDRNINYDTTKFKAGDTINIPVEEVTIQNSPRGMWGRFLWQS